MEYCLLPKGSHVETLLKRTQRILDFLMVCIAKETILFKTQTIIWYQNHTLTSCTNHLLMPKKTQSGFVIRTTTHKRPTNPVGYQFSLTHGPSTGLSTVGDNSSPIDVQTNENILATLAKMGIQGDIKTSSETEVQEEV